MNWTEFLGSLAAVCTTLCWIPQAVKIIREKQAGGISILTQTVFTIGIALWACYGFLVHRWPLIVANLVTFAFSATILFLKLRYNTSRNNTSPAAAPQAADRVS